MNPINNNNISYRGSNVSKFITRMTKADAMAPIVALEATVVSGRTYQAYKRGKWDEARERFIEETIGSIVWLCGVASMNALGDKLVAKILKSNGKNFDVGTDKLLRTPFDNFMNRVAPKGFTPKQVALLKGAKVLTSIIITNLFIGFVVPKLNQALTHKLRHDRKADQDKNKTANPSFKGKADSIINGINVFTNAIENTNTGKLLSSDAGIAGGRMYNARSKEERREIAIRDIGSIYFYMWAQGHVRNLLNYAEMGKSTRLNPSTTAILDETLSKFLESKGNSMSVEDFRKAVIGKKDSEIKIPEGVTFETKQLSALEKFFKKKPLEVVKLSEVEKYVKDNALLSKIREMSKLQPERVDGAVLTKQQLKDAMNESVINDPKFLDKVFTEFSGGKNKQEYKYISNNKLYALKQEMIDYVELLCKTSKDGKINKGLLKKVKNKNIMYNGINFMAGFAVAAAFLSTFIPKIQYYVTRKTTGVDAFPGVYDYENHRERVD